MNTKRLQVRIMLIIGVAFTLVFASVILFISIRVNRIVMDDELKAARDRAGMYAQTAESLFNEGFYTSRSMASTFSSYYAIPADQRRSAYAEILKDALNLNNKFKSVWVVLEPNIFDNRDVEYVNNEYSNDAGRFSPAFYRAGSDIKISIPKEQEVLSSDYYLKPKNENREVIIEPYKYDYTGTGEFTYISSISIPIYNNDGKFIGVTGIDIDLAGLQEYIDSQKQLMQIFSNEGKIIAHYDVAQVDQMLTDSDKDLFGEDKVKELAEQIKLGKEDAFVFYSDKLKSEAYMITSPINIGNTGQPWSFGYAVPLKIALAKTNSLKILVLIITIIGLALLFIILYYITLSITKPILKTARFVDKISEGDLMASIDIHRQDEIGQMVGSLRKMGEKLREIITGISLSADNIAEASMQLSSSSQQLSQGANEQAASVEEISSTMEQMAANISSNKENALQTEKISTEATTGILEVADRSGKAVDANKTILNKIGIINDIAFQTNILALNAAVEAARAGEHGKGFAVVASEVRKLAEHSKLAAEEIVKLTHESFNLSNGAGEVMNTTIPKVQNTTKLIQEITAASIEQDNGANQVNSAIQQLNNVTQQNATSSEEMASSSEELAGQAENLREIISFFKIGTESNKTFHKKATKEARSKQPISQNKPVKGAVINLKEKQTDKSDEGFESF